jgi:multidrug efflux pump subunit AcrB
MSAPESANAAPARLGLSGRIARAFLTSEITPLLALCGMLLGLLAVFITAREEEPQIDVTMANVFVAMPGASAREVESLITTPAERIAAEIDGVEHIYSMSTPGMAQLTVRFAVGEPRQSAIVRLYNAFYSNQDWLPAGLGVSAPLIKPMGIDDVPVVALTLWSDAAAMGPGALLDVARAIQNELQRVPGTRDIELIGAPDHVLRVRFDPARLSSYGLSLVDLRRALGAANAAAAAGRVERDGGEVLVQAGTLLATPSEAADLVVGMHQGAPVFLQDVAHIALGSDDPERYVTHGRGPAASAGPLAPVPALTIAISKKPGENAVDVARGVRERIAQLHGTHIPDAVQVAVTRDYGRTAADKAQTLIHKLIFATLSVVLLVLITLGWREALVVGAAVAVTLAITLFASWAWGFTLNRVSLFALIFSIGILVDDAIVVVENIHRHLSMKFQDMRAAIAKAVDEVGGPTILATFTVIAALLPMAFVSGLMGPYMRPIPINASTGMLFSLLVAFVFTPWLYRRAFAAHAATHHEHVDEDVPNAAERFFARIMLPFLRGAGGGRARRWLFLSMVGLIAISGALVAFRLVVLKMLPFDNKSEFQLVVDLPEGTPVQQTHRVLQALAERLREVPEVADYQIYAGTAAPINFNGLVRQYFLRQQPHQGDIQVNLVDKHERTRQSHEIAVALRPMLIEVARKYQATLRVVEIPPGPPVLAPLVAEIYAADAVQQLELTRRVRAQFERTPDVVDVDDTLDAVQPKWTIAVDRARAAKLGVAQREVVDAIAAALGGGDYSYLHDDPARAPIPIRLELDDSQKSGLDALLGLRVRGADGALVALSEVTIVREGVRDQTIHHKDLLSVAYVMGDVAGGTDSPLYGLWSIAQALDGAVGDLAPVAQHAIAQPEIIAVPSVKWDGEWQITYETFRDMGLAYAVGLVLIYLLIVGEFRSYTTPLVIMAPIPLTVIGIMPGHALLGQQFTAPSMIGMIALAGIIVRNSILLVDFIHLELAAGRSLDRATVRAAAVRARPIALTAIAAMMGGFFILDDPIFGGLAVSLIFGLLVSTVLTLLVIPVAHYHAYWRRHSVEPLTDA